MKTNLETSIDRFVKEIKKRGKITFSEAQRIFGISEEQVEEWAKLLAEHREEVGIEIHYPTFGEPEIVAIAAKKGAEVQKKVAKLEKNAAQLENILEKYSESGPEPKKEMETAEKPKEIQKKGMFGFGFLRRREKPAEASKQADIAGELRLLERELEETKRVEKTIDRLSEQARQIEETAKSGSQKEGQMIVEAESVQKTLTALKKNIGIIIPAVQKNIRAIEAKQLNPRLASEIKATMRRIQTDLDEVEGYARKFEGKKAKSRLASLLKKAAMPRKFRKKAKKHEKKRGKGKAKRR